MAASTNARFSTPPRKTMRKTDNLMHSSPGAERRMPLTPGNMQHYVDETPPHVDTEIDLRFKLGARVGVGSGAKVCEAVRKADYQVGVLKISTAPGSIQEWQREKTALEALGGHPYICRLYEAFVDARHCPPAATLFMQRLWPLPEYSPELAMSFLHDLAHALEHLWAFKYVHGDVKPANVCISDHLVLCDFGTACRVSPKWTAGLQGTSGYNLGYKERQALTPQQGFAVDQHALAVSVLQIEACSCCPVVVPSETIVSNLDPVLLGYLSHGRALLEPTELVRHLTK